MLEEYNILRQEKEQERKRQRVWTSFIWSVVVLLELKCVRDSVIIMTCTRIYLYQDQKKLEGQLIAEQEVLFGSKPSPMKTQNAKKGSRLSCGGTSNRRLSLGGAMIQTPKTDQLHSFKGTPNTRQTKKNERPQQNGHLNPRRDGGSTALSAGNFFIFL